MDSRQPELSRLTLMCSDHEVAEFTWNHDRQAVTGKTHVLDAAHAPLMATDPSGNITRDRLSSWFKNRGIPDFRPDAADRLRAVGYPSAASLMASGFGASLSDQYWIRPAGSASTWRDVNCFENDFSEELGELLLPHDASSVPSLIEKIRGNADLLASSPDAALNGNLPKRWTIEGGQRMLVKSGRSSGRFQEPFNEKIASVLCSRLLDEGEVVPAGETGKPAGVRAQAPAPEPLRLVVPCIVAGIGCRRGACAEAIEEAFLLACGQAGISPSAVRKAATIDVKAHEEGLLAFCRARNIPLATYSADELSQVDGSVSPSDFVRATVGVDNVCERAALADGGKLIFPKLAHGGVTVAFSKVTIELSFKER